jgi:hypothetical protein
MRALGLGRVVTLQLGLRADATGQVYRDTTDLSNFYRDSIGGAVLMHGRSVLSFVMTSERR